MNITFFLDQCTEILSPGKNLTAAQWSAYREKLAQFNEDQIQKLFDAVLENCKYFPKISDIYEQARLLGFMERQTEYKPHVWTPTDCQLCGGSGLCATFWMQEFDEEKTQILRLRYMMPYHTSGAYQRQQDHNDVRAAYRCLCDAGAAETLQRHTAMDREHADNPQEGSIMLFHGGIGDLWKGSVIRPNMAHVRYLDNCPQCQAQRAGVSGILGMDPETPMDYVYATSDRDYARYYASRAVQGWLYEVELDQSSIEASAEDWFPTWRAHSARVVRVLEKRITLTMDERKALFLRWGGSESEFSKMLHDAARSVGHTTVMDWKRL